MYYFIFFQSNYAIYAFHLFLEGGNLHIQTYNIQLLITYCICIYPTAKFGIYWIILYIEVYTRQHHIANGLVLGAVTILRMGQSDHQRL